MYLAKVHVAPEKSRNAYELHRALWELFPDRPDDMRSFLFRVEQHNHQAGTQILLQSMFEPIVSSDHARCLVCKAVDYGVMEKQQLRFRLRANPVKSVKDERKGTVTRKGTTYTRSARVPLIKEEQQHDWLLKKFRHMGAELLAVTITQEAPLYFRKNKEKRSGKIQPVLFEGVLEVTDPAAFMESQRQGIGPAKSFGMGLLSLATA